MIRPARRPRRQPRPDDLPGAGAHRLEPGQPRPAGLPGQAAGGPGRHRAPAALPRRAGPARIPDPARGREHTAAVPSLMWPGWALRLLPPWGRDFQRSRALLAVMLAVAVAGAEVPHRPGTPRPGAVPPGNRSQLHRPAPRAQVLEPVTAAICQLARDLDQHGAPASTTPAGGGKARFSQAQLDAKLAPPARPPTRADTGTAATAPRPGAPAHEQFARLRLIELLTGTHPRYLPGPLRLPQRTRPGLRRFAFTVPGQMDLCLRRRASALLPRPASTNPSPGNRRSAGSPASPGPDPTRPHQPQSRSVTLTPARIVHFPGGGPAHRGLFNYPERSSTECSNCNS